MSAPTVPLRVSLPNMLRLYRDPIGVFTRYRERYGSNFFVPVGGARHTLLTTDPEVVQHVLQRNHRNYYKSEIQSTQLAKYLGHGLLTNNGDDWLRQRRLIQPGFHRERLQHLVALMQEVIAEQVAQLADAAAEQRPVDTLAFTLETAFRIIARTLFSQGLGERELHELSRGITELQEFVVTPIRLPFLRPFLRWSGVEGRYLQKSALLFQQLQRLIDERRRSGEQRDDLLQMLLDSRYEDTGQAMTPRRLLEELVILFVAGHETSANALTWTLYLLAHHPRVAAQVREEIGSVPLDMARLRELPLLTQVVEESMRLYPPAWITDRVALNDDVVNGIELPAGTVVAPFIYGLHHHPDFWPQPEQFRPDRFTASARQQRPAFAYLPFGSGPRQCIGNSFAMMEMQLAIAAIVRRFELNPLNKRPVGKRALVTVRPARKVWLGFREAGNAPFLKKVHPI